jgi:hypothetical protein
MRRPLRDDRRAGDGSPATESWVEASERHITPTSPVMGAHLDDVVDAVRRLRGGVRIAPGA